MSKVFYQHKFTIPGKEYPVYSNNLERTLKWLEKRQAAGIIKGWEHTAEGYEVEEEAL